MAEELEFIPGNENESMNAVVIPRDENIRNGYYGVIDGVAPQIDNETTNGQAVFDGVVLAQFENSAQAIASLYYTRFAFNQIISVLPHIASFGEIKLAKIITNKCSRAMRYQFIKFLVDAPPRRLYDSEYLAIVKAVGQPAAKVKRTGVNITAVKAMITVDIENIDMLMPTEKGAAKVQVYNPDTIKGKIEKLTTKIILRNKKLETAKAQLAKMETKYSEKPTTNLETDIKIKTQKIEYDELVIAKFNAQLVKWQSKIEG